MSVCVRVCNPSLEVRALQSLLYTQDTVSNRVQIITHERTLLPSSFQKTHQVTLNAVLRLCSLEMSVACAKIVD